MHNKVATPSHSGITGVHFPHGFPKPCCDAAPAPTWGRRERSFPCTKNRAQSWRLCTKLRFPAGSFPPGADPCRDTTAAGGLGYNAGKGGRSFQPIPGRSPALVSTFLPPGMRGVPGEAARRGPKGSGSSGAPHLPRQHRAGQRGQRGLGAGDAAARRVRAAPGRAGTHRGGGSGRLGLREPVGGGAVGAARGEQPGRRGRAGAGGQPGVGAVEPGVSPLPHVREVGHLPQAEPPHHGRAAGAGACPGPAPAPALPALRSLRRLSPGGGGGCGRGG